MDHLQTEARNPASTYLDQLSPLQLVRLMNAEDAKVIPAVAAQAGVIARAISVIAERLRSGGRLIYAGAGTSGRLGVLDATECPPTFSAPPGQVIGIIAGGMTALTQAVEGAEDHPEFAERDLQAVGLSPADVVVGIATSGRTPYVLGALAYARRLGAYTIGFSCNEDSELNAGADLAITPVLGPEVLSGSTRLKAGTATKLVLNMLTTGAMVRLGKTYGNLMVDLRATNEKLRARTNRIVRQLTGLDQTAAAELLERCGKELKTALVAHLAEVGPEEARQRLQAASGQVRAALAPGAAAESPRGAADLVLGVDAGGTQTRAMLARVFPDHPRPRHSQLLGSGSAGPANMQVVGLERTLEALDAAVDQAFAASGVPRQMVASACLGLAGAGRPQDQALIRAWAEKVGLAEQIEVTGDVPLLLGALNPWGWGIAVIAGTGSIAFARATDGRTARAGGWGPLLGDEGSGYALVVAALQAVARSADGRGPFTLMTQRFLERLGLSQPQELIRTVYDPAMDRRALAALAPLVVDAADAGDALAETIVQQGVNQLAEMAVTVARTLALEEEPRFVALGRKRGMARTPCPLALGGGLVLGSSSYRARLHAALEARQFNAFPVVACNSPEIGAVELAFSKLIPPAPPE